MTSHDDLDQQLTAFLRDGPTELPDPSFDAVRDRTEQTRQRVVLGPWRLPDMNKILGFGLAAVAVVAVVLIGSQVLGSADPGGLGTGSTPTPEPSIAEPTSTPDGFLPEGPFLVVDTGAPAGAPSITVTIPAPGWTSLIDFGGLAKGPDEDPPQSAILLWSWPAGTTFQVFGDPCHWATTERIHTTTVDEFAAALAAQPSRDGSGPLDVTVGAYAGKHVTLHVPEDWDGPPSAWDRGCDLGTFGSYGVNGGEVSRSHQGPGQIDELWILDVDGGFAIVDVMYRPDTPLELVEEMRAIAESATFEAP